MLPGPYEYEFAVICALPCEFNAFDALFDERYSDLDTERYHGDSNFYQTGRIGTSNVVLTCLPEMGKTKAANAASTLRSSFPNITLTLVVGICGGVPSPTKNSEIILGDVIISRQIVKYDFGRQYPDRFEQKGAVKNILDPWNEPVQTLLSGLQTRRLRDKFQDNLSRHLQTLQADPVWMYPGVDKDRLYPSFCPHNRSCEEEPNRDSDNDDCSWEPVFRRRLDTGDNPQPCLHLGVIASGDTVMKSAKHRDCLADKLQVIGFEMEGAGVCEALSSLVIKGVCDYADSHKNKDWQNYAAASAACCAKAFLEGLSQIKLQQYGLYVYSRTWQPSTGRLTRRIIGQSSSAWEKSSVEANELYLNQGVRSAEEGLEQLGNEIQSPALRRELMTAGNHVIQSYKGKLQRLGRSKNVQFEVRKTLFGTLSFRTQIFEHHGIAEDEDSMSTETRTSFIFHPAQWLLKLGLRWGLNATAINSHSTWQYALRPVHARPDDALIFDLCRDGNVKAVSRLISRGEASVYDTDTAGYGTLHYAVRDNHLDLAKFLIRRGADRTAAAYNSKLEPVVFIKAQLFNEVTLKLLSLFDDCIEFDGEESSGWMLLNPVRWKKDLTPSQAHDWYSYLLCNYRAEYSGNYSPDRVMTALQIASLNKDLNAIKIILEFVPAKRGYTELLINLRVLDSYNPFFNDGFLLPQVLIDRGADTQSALQGETLTFLALRFSLAFFDWSSNAKLLYPVLDGFVEKELSKSPTLGLQKWDRNTLQGLFLLETTQELEAHDIECIICQMREYTMRNWELIIEPWWEELKLSVKAHECLCSKRHWIRDGRRKESLKHTCGRGNLSLGVSSRSNLGQQSPGTQARQLQKDQSPKGNWQSRNRWGVLGSQSTEEQGNTNAHARIRTHSDCAVIDSPVVKHSDSSTPTEDDPSSLFCWRCSDGPTIYATLTDYFYSTSGGWKGLYKPGEYYCFQCLAVSEGWALEPFQEDLISAMYRDYWCAKCGDFFLGYRSGNETEAEEETEVSEEDSEGESDTGSSQTFWSAKSLQLEQEAVDSFGSD